jgi:thiopeptide-type bacteriocin biosynthesis protein
VLEYALQTMPALGRREMSVLLLNALFGAAGLDPFEAGDVFDRVAHLRPTPVEDGTARLNRLADQLRALLMTPLDSDHLLFVAGGALNFAAPWLDAHHVAGRALGDAATNGQLSRGLRALLSQVVIFHWNRLGLTATTQGVLARAATMALLPVT